MAPAPMVALRLNMLCFALLPSVFFRLFGDSTLLIQSLNLGPDARKNGITHDLGESRG